MAYFEMFNNLLKSRFIEMLVDGVHPNSRGHDLIFKIVGKKLLNLFLPGRGRSQILTRQRHVFGKLIVGRSSLAFSVNQP